MKLLTTLLAFAFIASQPASAIITLGTSNELFGLTGIGANSSGQGVSKMSWGACTFDGVNTSCSLTGSYTGLNAGGTYNFNVTYPGNGAFPLNAVSQTPGSDFFFAQGTGPLTFMITLTQNSGPVLHFYDFANFSFFYPTSAPLATCTGSPSSCSVGQVGLTPGSTISGHITGTFDPSPMIRVTSGVISAGGYGGFASIAPATWMEIYGVNLANTLSQTWGAADFNGSQAPSTLGGTTVTVAGKPAYIDFVSPGQVNAQVPSGIGTGTQPVVVTTAGGISNSFNITVNAVQPGLLAPSAFLVNGKQNVVALFSNTLTFVLPNSQPGVSTARARPGDQLTLYGIGFGTVTPDTPAGRTTDNKNALTNNFAISFGGVQANVTYAGLTPSAVGLYQFNVTVPNIPANDATPVDFTLNGVHGTQNLIIAITN